ncbi:Anaphase-promoting complex subunit 7 [Smittium culicis]|uniref:Anaphase-promoting complex subunit 7 n=1 Tax=Smittium culicis TaxID=133412 RepID=A0A1R1Y5T5_9FUNG|nr:Anaphase-promoting complex subunit 7 [Smittium culicis]
MLAQSGKILELESLGKKLIPENPMRPEGYLAISKLNIYNEKFIESVDILDIALNLNLCTNQQDVGYLRLAKSESFLGLENYDEAFRYSEIAGGQLRNTFSMKLSVDVYLSMNDFDRALKLVKNVSEICGSNPVLLNMMAKVLMHSNESYEQTKALLETVLEIDEGNEEAFAMLVTLHLNNKQYEHAMGLLKDKVQEFNKDVYYVQYGDLLTVSNNLVDAEVCYNMAKSLNPRNARANSGLLRLNEIAESEDCGIQDESQNDDDDGLDIADNNNITPTNNTGEYSMLQLQPGTADSYIFNSPSLATNINTSFSMMLQSTLESDD